MSRRSGFGSIMTAVARDIARSQRQAEAARKRSLREYEQSLRIAQREQVRQTKIADREAKQQYFEDRIAEAEDKTSVVSSFLEELNSMLEHTPSVNDEIVFDSLQVTEKFQEKFQEFSPSPDLMAKSSPPLKDTCLARKPVFPVNLFPWVKKQYQKRLTDGEKRHKEAISEYETKEQNREELKRTILLEFEDYLVNKFKAGNAMLGMLMTDSVVTQIMQKIEAMLDELIPKLFGSLTSKLGEVDIEQLVYDRVMRFSDEKFEDLLMAVIKKELKFIESAGAVLGFIIGLIQVGLIVLSERYEFLN